MKALLKIFFLLTIFMSSSYAGFPVRVNPDCDECSCAHHKPKKPKCCSKKAKASCTADSAKVSMGDTLGAYKKSCNKRKSAGCCKSSCKKEKQ